MIEIAISVVNVLVGVLVGHWLAEQSEQKRWERDFASKRRTLAASVSYEIKGIIARLDAVVKTITENRQLWWNRTISRYLTRMQISSVVLRRNTPLPS